MSGIAPDQRGDDLLYYQENTELNYDRMLELLDDLSSQGSSVVLDVTFGKREFCENSVTGQNRKIRFEVSTIHCP